MGSSLCSLCVSVVIGRRCMLTTETQRQRLHREELRRHMQDLVFIGLTIFFFLIALAYVHGCERLR